jgi:hypothetical protein
MDWSKKFKATNLSHGKIVAGALFIPYEESIIVDPYKYPEEVIQALIKFEKTKRIEVTNEVGVESIIKQESPVNVVKTIKSVDGDTNDHFVYDGLKPTKAVTVEEISMNGKAISVDNDFDKAVAKQFLEQHWKRVASDVSKVEDVSTLENYLEVAIEYAMAEKKIEIIKERLAELK